MCSTPPAAASPRPWRSPPSASTSPAGRSCSRPLKSAPGEVSIRRHYGYRLIAHQTTATHDQGLATFTTRPAVARSRPRPRRSRTPRAPFTAGSPKGSGRRTCGERRCCSASWPPASTPTRGAPAAVEREPQEVLSHGRERAMSADGEPATSEIVVRPATVADAEACGRICYEGFRAISERHGFPPIYASVEAATGRVRAFLEHPAVSRGRGRTRRRGRRLQLPERARSDPCRRPDRGRPGGPGPWRRPAVYGGGAQGCRRPTKIGRGRPISDPYDGDSRSRIPDAESPNRRTSPARSTARPPVRPCTPSRLEPALGDERPDAIEWGGDAAVGLLPDHRVGGLCTTRS